MIENAPNQAGSKNILPSTIEQIKEYEQKVINNRVACILPACPQCETSPAQFIRHELRKRRFHVIVNEFIKVIFSLLIRWKCAGCGKTFTQYPDFALPYKRYTVPDIIAYTERYVNEADLTYARLIQQQFAVYEGNPDKASQLWPSTVHRWIGTLGLMRRVLQKAQSLIHQKYPDSGITRDLSHLTIDNRKFKTRARQIVLTTCRQLLYANKVYFRAFGVSLFPKLAAEFGHT